MHIKGKWRRHSDAAQAAFVTHCSGVRSQEKKDDQVSGTGRTKGSSVSGANQGYPTRKDCLCGRMRHRYLPVPWIWVCVPRPTGIWAHQRAQIPTLWDCCRKNGRSDHCALSIQRNNGQPPVRLLVFSSASAISGQRHCDRNGQCVVPFQEAAYCCCPKRWLHAPVSASLFSWTQPYRKILGLVEALPSQYPSFRSFFWYRYFYHFSTVVTIW